MARRPSERRHSEEELEEVNLIPIMSILCILIPVLILAFNFFEVSIQQVAAPKIRFLRCHSRRNVGDQPALRELFVAQTKLCVGGLGRLALLSG